MNDQRNKTPQLIILSGKGGTGKTSISAGLVHLWHQQNSTGRLTVVDADVDAANLNLLLNSETLAKHEFWSSSCAQIDPENCAGCGDCIAVCRYDAIFSDSPEAVTRRVDPIACDGCAACVYACGRKAIRMISQLDGHWLHSRGDYGMLFHAELLPGKENSGKLVSLIKQKAQKWAEVVNSPLMIIDGPPGIGCPVISACSGTDLALLITEPGLAGLHDLQRIYATLKHFKIPAILCINKADLYPQGTLELESYAQHESIKLVTKIPFDPNVHQAVRAGMPLTAYAPTSAAAQSVITIMDEVLRWMASRA